MTGRLARWLRRFAARSRRPPVRRHRPAGGDTLVIPRLALVRLRWLLAASLAVNLALGWQGSQAHRRARVDRALVVESVRLAESAQRLSLLFGDQLDRLALANAAYRAALEQPEERADRYAAYAAAMTEFEREAETFLALNSKIKRHAARVTALLAEEEGL